MDNNNYQGYRIFFIGKTEKISQNLHLDLSTGDKITPEEINLTYKTFLLQEEVNIKSYNIETVVAEKLETVLTRGIANTRMKDFYDLFIINKILFSQMDFDILKLAFLNTLSNRETVFILDIKDEVLSDLSTDKHMSDLWIKYSNTYSFAQNISYLECIEAIDSLLSLSTQKTSRH